ncbi:hypothetical protein GINT2_000186 [Glugoides intestinalis]
MEKRPRSIISSLIAAIIYFLFYQPKDVVEQHSSISPSIVLLDEKNIIKLNDGKWVIITDNLDISKHNHQISSGTKYGVLVVNNMKKAKIAASLGLKDATDCICLENGAIDGERFVFSASFEKILDYFVYYCAIKMKHGFSKVTGIHHLIEFFGLSFMKMSYEVLNYCLHL